MNKKEQCMFYNWARRQRQSETNRGEGFDGTQYYEKVGCYKCSGFNVHCQFYEVIPRFKNSFLEDVEDKNRSN